MRTKTLRGLAAGAGSSAVLLAGATAGFAASTPQPEAWESSLEGMSQYQDVSCLVSTLPGPQSATYLDEGDWSPLLSGDKEFVAVVLEGAGGATQLPFDGYGRDNLYLPEAGQISYLNVCQATVVSGEGAADDAEEVTPDDESAADASAADEATEDQAAGEGAAADDAAADGAGEATEDEAQDAPAGPAVETDGPATPAGANVGLIGGALLALAGAGAAGWATLRRRTGPVGG